jgi:hypothetical protein
VHDFLVTSAVSSGLISSVPTALVAIAALWNASRMNRQGIEATRRRDQDSRQASAYEQAAEYLMYRQAERTYQLHSNMLDDATQEEFQQFLGTYDQGRWFAANGQLVLYASDEVRDAVDAANAADREVRLRNREWKRRERQAVAISEEKGPAAIPTGLVDHIAEARKRTFSALADSARLENALIDLLREDMAHKPSLFGRWPGSQRIYGTAPPQMPAVSGSSALPRRGEPTQVNRWSHRHVNS